MGNSGKIINEGRINQVLALIVDVNNETLSVMISKLREEQYKRNHGRNIDTIQA